MKNRKLIKLVGIAVFAIFFLFLGFFIFKNQATAPTEKITNSQESNSKTAQLANPASTKCTEMGGTLTIKTRGDGGQYGLCELKNGAKCEEWALFRGECPQKNAETTKLESEIQMYCVWIGGKLDNINQNTCTLPSGKVCDTTELYNGICPTNQN